MQPDALGSAHLRTPQMQGRTTPPSTALSRQMGADTGRSTFDHQKPNKIGALKPAVRWPYRLSIVRMEPTSVTQCRRERDQICVFGTS